MESNPPYGQVVPVDKWFAPGGGDGMRISSEASTMPAVSIAKAT
jgi:hypothetical protein